MQTTNRKYFITENADYYSDTTVTYKFSINSMSIFLADELHEHLTDINLRHGEIYLKTHGTFIYEIEYRTTDVSEFTEVFWEELRDALDENLLSFAAKHNDGEVFAD